MKHQGGEIQRVIDGGSLGGPCMCSFAKTRGGDYLTLPTQVWRIPGDMRKEPEDVKVWGR